MGGSDPASGDVSRLGWLASPTGWASALLARLEGRPLAAVVVLVASWQVTMRSEDPSGVARVLTLNVLNGTGGDLSQYRVFSYYLADALQKVFNTPYLPFAEMRFGQCVLIFGLSYALYGQLGIQPRTRLLGIAMVAGLTSLSLGTLGPSTFSLDRFTDTIFFLIAALLVVRGHEGWIPPLMVLAVANRETSVFIPAMILAKHVPSAVIPAEHRPPASIPPNHSPLATIVAKGPHATIMASQGALLTVLTDRRLRQPLLTAAAAWAVAALVYLGIHAYYGPRPRIEESYFGPAMVLHSLGMAAQSSFFFAMINLLPVVGLVAIKDADPFLRRLFWLVVPLWFALHIWAARLGEGMMYLAPITVIVVPIVLQGLERRLTPVESPVALEFAAAVPRPPG